MFSIEFMVQAVTLLQKIVAGGAPLVNDVRQVLANHSVELDNEALDRVILDAERRRALAETEARS